MSSGGSGSAGSGTAPSQTHHVQCKYCDEKPLIKNYKTHLLRKHKDKNPSDKAGKGQQSISTFVKAGPSGKRSRSSDDGGGGGSKKRHCSGDSAIDVDEDQPEDDDEACENVTNVNRESGVEEEVAGVIYLPQDFGSTSLDPHDDVRNVNIIASEDEAVSLPKVSASSPLSSTCLVQQQSSSMSGGSGRPGQVGKLPQDFGSTSLGPHDDVRNVNIIAPEDEAASLPKVPASSPLSSFQIPLLEEIKKIALNNEMKLDLILQGNFHKEKAREDEETKVLSRNDKAAADDSSKMEMESLDSEMKHKINDARSIEAIERIGFTYKDKVLVCNTCHESLKYDGTETDFTEVKVLPRAFRNLKTNIQSHLTTKVHKDAVFEETARGDEETKVLSRNDKAAMIVGRQAYSHIKMRRPEQDFEKELFLLSKAGVDIGTLNHSANFIGKFRPFLDKTIRLQINNFFSTPTIPTGFTPALAYTGMFACYNFILEQIL